MQKLKVLLAAAATCLVATSAANAGAVFLTGHDPDFHAEDSTGADNLLTTMLNYVTGGTTFSGAGDKFLYVQSNNAPDGNHRDGVVTLNHIGLTAGVNFDQVNAAGLAGVNFSNYTAIVVASDFGAMLTSAEIDELIARSADIASFINSGGGLAAFAECGVGFPNCISSNVNASTNLFGFLPVTVTPTSTTAPYTVTAFGASLGLTNGDINDPTHNSFSVIGGLNIVDTDAAGIPSSLAGIVTVGGGGFTPVGDVPEPLTLSLLGAGLAGAAAMRRRKSKSA